MSRQLAYRPNPEHLRKEAKALLKAHKRAQADCCEVLRNLHHFKDRSDYEILGAKVNLSAMQFALAMDYGFTTWPELMQEVGARLGTGPENDTMVVGGRFSQAKPVEKEDRIYLDPIPRYPCCARELDENGKVLRHLRDKALRCRILGNLYCAMNMIGGAVESHQVATAAGTAFRFAFEPSWAQDAEFVTDVDEFAQACETLGFKYRRSMDTDLNEAFALIDSALAKGKPAIITGWGDRFSRVIVGREKELYRHIGGVE
ncbi:hypothetical protein ACFL1X_12405, partial [Candidatus Hydrogenedentota bacterium]